MTREQMSLQQVGKELNDKPDNIFMESVSSGFKMTSKSTNQSISQRCVCVDF